eukprot:781666_1
MDSAQSADDETAKKYPLQIINAGMLRGGTTSLSLALVELGFGPTWHLRTNSYQANSTGLKWCIDHQVADKMHSNEEVDFDEFFQLTQCQTAMSLVPFVFYWDKLFAQYPKSKVIMSVRDFDSWAESYINFLSHTNHPMVAMANVIDPGTNLGVKLLNNNHKGDGYDGVAEFLALDKSKR